VAELTPEQWGFVYQLIVLGIGAGITLKLVPHFTNKYQEKQIEIDRNREDRRQQLEIQHSLIEKTAVTLSMGTLIVLNFGETHIKKTKIPNDKINEFLTACHTLSSLIDLYYEKSEVSIIWYEIYDIFTWAVDEIDGQALNRSDKEQKEDLQIILERINSPIDIESALQILHKEGVVDLTTKFNQKYGGFEKLIMKNIPKIL